MSDLAGVLAGMGSIRDKFRLNRRLGQLETKAPGITGGWIAWIRRPSHRLFRIPLGAFLTVGSVFSILPVFGFWMLPLGLMLLAIDVPLLRSPVNAAITGAERAWRRWRS